MCMHSASHLAACRLRLLTLGVRLLAFGVLGVGNWVELPRFRGLCDPREGRKESTMARKSRRAYPATFRQELVQLVRTGRTPEELSRAFEPSAQTIRNWVAQADRDDGQRTDGLTTDEPLELHELRRENARLREEREILKKAAAWFARETGTIPPGSSHS